MRKRKYTSSEEEDEDRKAEVKAKWRGVLSTAERDQLEVFFISLKCLIFFLILILSQGECICVVQLFVESKSLFKAKIFSLLKIILKFSKIKLLTCI